MPHVELLVGLALIAIGLTYGRATFRVLSLRLRTELAPERVEAAQVPADLRALLESESRALAELGFEPVAWVRTLCALDGVDQPTWSRLLQHPAEKSFAWLTVCGSSRTRPCEVSFHAQADEGRRLETLAYPLLDEHPPCEKHLVVDAETVSFAEQWERHQRELAARPDFAPRDVSADELLVEQRGASKCALQTSLELGRFAPAGEGLARFTLRHAIAVVVSSTRRDSRKRAALAKLEKARLAQGAVAASPAPEPVPGDVSAEVWAHRRRDGAERSRRSGWIAKLVLFGLSVGAAAVAFGLELSLETVAILFGVLLVHELGHALAMMAFGYRNLQILFIPFFGAVASGQKRDVAPWQEIVVLLAGPVPGIAAGTALLCAVEPETSPLLGAIAWSMLIVNYANLLPIMPLDGGRILNVALFDRFPNLQLGFAALSGLALIGLGTALGEMVLRAIGIVMLIGLPAQWRHGRLLAGARARLTALAGGAEPADPVPALYTELRHPRFDSLNSEGKYQLVTQLAERLLRRPAGAGLAALSVIGWLAVMVLPLGVVSYRAVGTAEPALAAHQAERERELESWKARIAAAATPKDEAAVRLSAGQLLFERFELAEARRQLEPSLALLAELDEPELEAGTLLALALLDQHPLAEGAGSESLATAARRLRRALDLRERRFGVESLEVAEVLEAFPAGGADDRVAALVRQLRLVGIYQRELGARPELRWRLQRALQGVAQRRNHGADHARAERALRDALAVAEAATGDEAAAMRAEALAQLTGFYFERGRFDDVRATLARRAENPFDGSLAADRCWLEYWQRAGEAASRCFAALREGSEAGEFGHEYAVDEAAAQRLAGNDPAARALLRQVGEDEDARAYLSALQVDEAELDFTGRERVRRRAERARSLEPLLASAK